VKSAQSWQRPAERFEDVGGRTSWSVHARCHCTNHTGDVVCAVVEESTDKLIGGKSDEGLIVQCGPGGDFPTEPPVVRYNEVDAVEDRGCYHVAGLSRSRFLRQRTVSAQQSRVRPWRLLRWQSVVDTRRQTAATYRLAVLIIVGRHSRRSDPDHRAGSEFTWGNGPRRLLAAGQCSSCWGRCDGALQCTTEALRRKAPSAPGHYTSVSKF